MAALSGIGRLFINTGNGCSVKQPFPYHRLLRIRNHLTVRNAREVAPAPPAKPPAPEKRLAYRPVDRNTIPSCQSEEQ